jgi:hypothetical protein
MKLSAQDWVEVRSKEEILRTLDVNGQLEGLPFMPEMFAYCGRRFRVWKRAHKTCDTVNKTGGRRMKDAVHLEGLRCDGMAHGGCQAACLLYWKHAWLKPVGTDLRCDHPTAAGPHPTEADVLAATRKESYDTDDPTYVCQTTELPRATILLRWWDARQYWEDYRSGNVSLRRLFAGLFFSCYFQLSQAGIGLGRILRWLYDAVQKWRGGPPFPRRQGTIPEGQSTPTKTLNLQPGELVRVKSHAEILATLDVCNRNRGMYFDAEEVPYCGGIYRVKQRVRRIINERTGKMMNFKNESVILDGVYCHARYSDRRLFCPRAIYPMWREIWLERAQGAVGSQNTPAAAHQADSPEAKAVSLCPLRKP